MADYEVNNEPVNERQDWRQQLQPGPVPKVEHGFPGEPSRFVTKGMVRPPDLIITGWLEAETFIDLYEQIYTWHYRQEWLDLFTVSIHGATFLAMDLWEFRLIDPEATAFSRGGATMVRQQVRFQWRQLED